MLQYSCISFSFLKKRWLYKVWVFWRFDSGEAFPLQNYYATLTSTRMSSSLASMVTSVQIMLQWDLVGILHVLSFILCFWKYWSLRLLRKRWCLTVLCLNYLCLALWSLYAWSLYRSRVKETVVVRFWSNHLPFWT